MSGFIYIIRCGNFAKVGYSADPKRRLKALAAANPSDLTLLASYPGTTFDETHLHAYLAPCRHRGEWFRWSKAIEEIVRLGLPINDAPPRITNPALQRAIKAVGTAYKLAELLDISPQALSQWEEVPPLRVLQVEKHTGVPRYELRPDIYPIGGK